MGLTYTTQARDAVRLLPPPTKRRVRAALRMLDEDPFHDGLDLKMLRRNDPQRLYRCRVQNHRILFSVHADGVRVRRVFHRRDGYGWLERL